MDDGGCRVPELCNFCAKCGALLTVSAGSGEAAACRLCGHASTYCLGMDRFVDLILSVEAHSTDRSR
jgi:hypothetical protein